MKLQFTKMHGAGNDFVVLDATRAPLELEPARWRALADRRFGIGADQILVVGRSATPGIDFSYRIFNSDGGEVEQCGNGARAFVRFVHEKGLSAKRALKVETMSGVIEPRLEDDGSITVDMGAPVLQAERVPFDATGLTPRCEGEDLLWPLDLATHAAGADETGAAPLWISAVSMGNPHAVQIVDDAETAPVARDGPLIEHHARFPKRVNAGFMQVVDRHTVRLRVWERGAGETLACGTGACAAVVAGVLRGRLDSPVTVHTHGGELRIGWAGGTSAVLLSGPAVTVFEGEIEI